MKNLIILAIVLAALGCANDKNCKNAICTEMFAMVGVKLKDTTNSDLSGISTQTVLKSSGQEIHAQSEPGNFPGNSFTVVDDSDLKEIGFNTSQEVELKIIKDGKTVKTIPFIIKTDCCHVSKVEGPEEVSLN